LHIENWRDHFREDYFLIGHRSDCERPRR
jgi:hypothetical protein